MPGWISEDYVIYKIIDFMRHWKIVKDHLTCIAAAAYNSKRFTAGIKQGLFLLHSVANNDF